MVPYEGVLSDDNKASYWVAALAEDGYKGFKKILETTTLDNLDGKTVYELKDEVNASADYYPITWTYKLTTGDTSGTPVSKRGVAALTDANTAMSAHFTANGTPNQKLDKSATLTWEWKASNVASDEGTALTTTVDANQDTILGNLIAEAAAETGIDAVSTPNAYAETNSFTVVKLGDDGKALTVQFSQVGTGNNVVCAYTGTAPTAASNHGLQDADVAVLTAAYDASLKIEQVD